jgi:hypothetical protein
MSVAYAVRQGRGKAWPEGLDETRIRKKPGFGSKHEV